MRSISFFLDIAPSVNNLYVNAGKKRLKSKDYAKWADNALKEMMAQKVRPVPAPVAFSIELPETMRGDLDGRIKATLDILVRAEIIPDDSKQYVRSVTASFYDGKRMRVTVQSLKGDE